MSEKTPENPQDQEPHGTDPVEPQIPDTEAAPSSGEREESISAEAIVNAPPTTEIDQPKASQAGEFRTKPLDLDVPFACGSTRQYPQQSQAYGQSQDPQQPTRQFAQAPTRVYEQRPQAPQTPQTGQTPPPGQAPAAHLASTNRASAPSHSCPRTYPSAPASYRPAGEQPHQPGQPQQPRQHRPPRLGPPPMPPPRPPRRARQRTEPVAYAPVTGSLPLSRDEVTEIPADGPITWPKRPTGIIGVANLVLSAVLALIWAWIPLGLLFTGIGGIFALGLGVLALLVWVLVQQGANNAERYRAELIYADKIPVPKIESSNRDPGMGRFLHNRWLQVKSGAFWRSTAHHYIKMLLGLIVVAGTIAAICGSIFCIFAAINPHGVNTFFIGETIDGPARIGVAIGSVIVLASSLAILWFAPLLDRALDRALLAPARTVALQAEVTELDRARMAGLEAAAAERLRIERDLHDGAQPRLVALTMTLGMAKTKIDSDPEKAKELVAEAHTEAKGIVNELRQLARGIHPAVLTDRGLDAAVSALAGRSTIPIDVDVRLEGRIGREAEAVSYFVVAECLTNIAKHSGATRASVFIAPTESGVQIVVTDNGHGGARVDRTGRHTGIAGLIDRVEAARGTLNLTSPAGGPTTVVVEVPCAS
ncbi:Signal transduction histidine kinase [Brevibacterium iodinum ATCC 49514]|uniref:histidine kinase n=1 Tax=Brevibacterium iodinum ATCC 49514 TaxID=1255616 RepID=A0A2H1HZ01_9MICO|nr:sensor histidine kinase [Brevibacterium iodinum]SMX68080.1 Signal transduction histidine kinase [Brevibacterium iodinum ATCC 49514]SUW13817.1 Oxygen sensor histidine kinase nreB [Brevibacterium iodinum]